MRVLIEQLAEGPDAGKWVLVEETASGGDIVDMPPLDTEDEARTAREKYIRECIQADMDERSEARGLAAMEGRMEDFNDLSSGNPDIPCLTCTVDTCICEDGDDGSWDPTQDPQRAADFFESKP